ncbi:Pyruvate phosphate dikinase, PEP/pyruvate binding domain [Brevibacterium antiquum]|uniref:Phosphoenolpyruvate synthase n=1 Tax=Brevibacterium antiquum TaxID=234835 RepID=A0A2H1JPA0_9MICO|nr:Pyruvate phosphate dikinase, PEP/pyruvate binding domain [Brevibacterium antiquum]
MTLTLGFTDPLAIELATSGGKSASLAKSAQDLPVPGGFIVTADAYTQFVDPLQAQITELMSSDRPAEAIGDLIRSAAIPGTWLAEFEAAAKAAGLSDQAVAVRSSGTMEDLPGAAFAGQHDTYLGVRGTEAIAEAVRDCYASLWNPHAFRYRQQLGVDQLDAKMAVVVQLMVSVGAEEAAGVAFSVDPVRGNTDEASSTPRLASGRPSAAGRSQSTNSGSPEPTAPRSRPRSRTSRGHSSCMSPPETKMSAATITAMRGRGRSTSARISARVPH